MDEEPDCFVTAISLEPLPPGSEIREALQLLFQRYPRPSNLLRAYADQLDAGLIPEGLPPTREANEWLDDYKKRAYRRTFRLPISDRDRLQRLAYASRLDQASLIRMAIRLRWD